MSEINSVTSSFFSYLLILCLFLGAFNFIMQFVHVCAFVLLLAKFLNNHWTKFSETVGK